MFDVLIIAHNEALNLPHTLASLQGSAKKVFVVDSGSVDGTQDIATQYGAEVVHHAWAGYAAQRNWALDHLPFESDWLLILDADEAITPELRDALLEVAAKPKDQQPHNGYAINRLTCFAGKPLRHCGYFPNWNLRFFRRGTGRYENREVHEHLAIDGTVGRVKGLMHHHDRRGLEHYFAKHNRYSTLEARSLYREIMGLGTPGDKENVEPTTRRRRWLKRNVMPYLPFPGVWRFFYMYVLRLGILDGRNGFQFCVFIGYYDTLVKLKLQEINRQYRESNYDMEALERPVFAGLAEPEGSTAPTRAAPEQAGSPAPAPASTAAPNAPVETAPVAQTKPESSPWSFTEKLLRAIWMIFGKPLFRCSFHNWYAYRNLLLKLFGAKIGKGVRIRPTVNVEIPWMLEIEDDSTIGDAAILYSLGHIRIGKRSIISQYAHLCAGSHDYTDHSFRLLRTPIVIGDDCWIGSDAFVGPGVRVGSLTVLGARSSAYKDLPAGKVCVGNPAHPIKDRELK